MVMSVLQQCSYSYAATYCYSNMSEAAMSLSCVHCLDCCACCYSCYQKTLYYIWCDTSLPPSQGNRTRGVFTRLVTRGANSRRANMLFSCTSRNFSVPTISGCSYTFLLSNQSSTLPPATHGVVVIYLHELMRSWLRRAVLTHKAEGFYVWHTLWWGVRLYLCVTVSSEL